MLVHINVKFILNFIWTTLGERRCKHYIWDGKVSWQSGARSITKSHHTTSLTQSLGWEKTRRAAASALCKEQQRTEQKEEFIEFVGEGGGTFQGEAFPGGIQVQRLCFLLRPVGAEPSS